VSKPVPKLGCVFYRTAGGDEPVREWLRALAVEICATIGKDILKIQWRWPISSALSARVFYEVRSAHDTGHTHTGDRHRTREAAHVSEKVMKKHIGSSFESFLEEKGIKDDVEPRAQKQKEILAEQIREAMERKGVSFSALAASMGTSRTVVYRLLDPSDTGVTLETLSRVARALGLGLKVSLARAPGGGGHAGLRKTA